MDATSYDISVKIGIKHPDTDATGIIRKKIIFSGFKEKFLADDFAKRLHAFVEDNASLHNIKEHVWIVRPAHIHPSDKQDDEYIIDPHFDFSEMVNQIIKAFYIVVPSTQTH